MVDILDHRGEPMRARAPTGQQSADLEWLHREFEGHPVRGLTPARLASLLEEIERGDLRALAELGNDLEERDSHIFTEVSKRRRALLSIPWSIEPPEDATAEEARLAERTREIVNGIPDLEDLILDLADAILKGWSCVEIEWRRRDGGWIPALHHRPPSWFTVHPDDRNTLRLRDGTAWGVALQPLGWIVHVHRARSGYLTQCALSRILAWPFLFKAFGLRDFADFLNIYGIPFRLGTYPPGATDDERATLLRAVTMLGRRAGAIIPEGMMIEIRDAARAGAQDPFRAMIDWGEASISRAVLGGTLTTIASPTGIGEGASGVQDEVRHELLHGDALQIGSTLSRDLVAPIAALNGAGRATRAPRWRYDTERHADIVAWSGALPRLVSAGMSIPERWAMRRLGIPAPESGEPVLRMAGAPARDPARESLRALLRTAAPASDADVPEIQALRLNGDAGGAMDTIIDALRAEAARDDAGGLRALAERLMRRWPDLDRTRLAAVMGEAFVAAELAGRYEVVEGDGDD